MKEFIKRKTGAKKMKAIIMSAFVAVSLIITGVSLTSKAETTVKENVQEMGQDTSKHAKRAVRATKDVVCMDSDAACLAQKAKHKAQNAGDEIGDKANDVKKKIN